MNKQLLAATTLVAMSLPSQATTYLNHEDTVGGLEYYCAELRTMTSPLPQAMPGEKLYESCTVNEISKRMTVTIAIMKADQPLYDMDPTIFMMGTTIGVKLMQESACLTIAEAMTDAGVALEEGWQLLFSFKDLVLGACPL